ncbi:MAG: protoglobin domain-containing protein [Myxococcota bacterium]
MHFFAEIKEYVGFDEKDEARLNALYPVIEPHFGRVVTHFYSALNENPRTRDIFSGPEQVERLRQTLHVWLEELFEGPHDQEYFERRQRIGQVHVDVGLLPQFMFGAMNIVRIELIRAMREEDVDELAENIESVERALDIDLTIMSQSYWDSLMEMKLQIPSALATGLAHEIRNPLNTIGLQMTLLERRLREYTTDVESDEKISPIVQAVRSELGRIRGLTTEIMDFAKPIETSPAWHDGRQLLEQLEQVHGPTLETSNIELKTAIEGVDEQIWCDMDRMQQVLVNLLTNAVEAIEDEGTIWLEIENAEYGTTIQVSDSGEGMPPTLKYRVFDLFYTTKASGTGIGLPIVKKIIEAHGGSIDVVSKLGEGTKFTVYLPRPETSNKAT